MVTWKTLRGSENLPVGAKSDVFVWIVCEKVSVIRIELPMGNFSRSSLPRACTRNASVPEVAASGGHCSRASAVPLGTGTNPRRGLMSTRSWAGSVSSR
jgi:hypothetical protein